jgi:hypothetical protein
MKKITWIAVIFILAAAAHADAYTMRCKVSSVGPAPGGVYIGLVADGDSETQVFQANPSREKEMEAVALVANALDKTVQVSIETVRGREIITSILVSP